MKKKKVKKLKKSKAAQKAGKKVKGKALKKPSLKPQPRKATAKKKEKKSLPEVAEKKKPMFTPTVLSQPQKKVIEVAPAKKLSNQKLASQEVQEVKDMLKMMRNRLKNQVSVLTRESLERSDEVSSIEDGTDAFDRQFALNVASTERDALLEVEEALQRIDSSVYGVCEECKSNIEKPRLKALPFVRLCIHCQSENEKGRARYRPI